MHYTKNLIFGETRTACRTLRQAMAAQEVTENILEEASAMDETMAATWEDDAQSCKARGVRSEKSFMGLGT